MEHTEITFAPLTQENWEDFAALFGERGACGGCWCMYWRLSRKQFEAQKGEGNRRAMRNLVEGGASPGILAYAGSRAVGWCALAPRDEYPYLARSRLFKPLDERPCWSVSCFFVDREWRNRSIASTLMRAAVAYARNRGAQRLEGYPVESVPGKRIPPAFAWNGLPGVFLRAGFHEVARPSPTRPVMRIELAG